jgi:hypothetical protein
MCIHTHVHVPPMWRGTTKLPKRLDSAMPYMGIYDIYGYTCAYTRTWPAMWRARTKLPRRFDSARDTYMIDRYYRSVCVCLFSLSLSDSLSLHIYIYIHIYYICKYTYIYTYICIYNRNRTLAMTGKWGVGWVGAAHIRSRLPLEPVSLDTKKKFFIDTVCGDWGLPFSHFFDCQ